MDKAGEGLDKDREKRETAQASYYNIRMST